MRPSTAARPLLDSREIWSEIDDVLGQPGPKSVAVAYVDSGSTLSGSLGSDDVLIVAAGAAQLQSGSTDPRVLGKILRAGCEIWSIDRLHAKVYCGSDKAVVGSANASGRSRSLIEAGYVTTDRFDIDRLRGWVRSLPVDVGAIRVDAAYLCAGCDRRGLRVGM